MHILLNKFHQGGNYTYQIESHQEKLRREEKLLTKNCLSVSSLQTEYLNLDRSSGCGRNNEK